MSATTLTKEPQTADEGYHLVKDLIFDQVYKFKRKYGGDFDELVGDANWAFAKGHQMYTVPGKKRGAYPVHIRLWVWSTLVDVLRARLSRNSRCKITTAETDETPDTVASNFNRAEFVSGLSEDAVIVTNLVLCPPPAVVQEANDKGGTPRNFKSTVRTYLRANGLFGLEPGPLTKADSAWSAERVTAAFEEISGALV